MLHRHLNHQRFTLAAIDGVIFWRDWSDPNLKDKIDMFQKTVKYVFEKIVETMGEIL
jgi:hypothetical protein